VKRSKKKCFELKKGEYGIRVGKTKFLKINRKVRLQYYR
jgi:hypothetical protein